MPTPGTYDPSTGVYTPLIRTKGASGAADTLASVTRAKYDDWKQRFFPKIDELANMTTYMNPGLIGQETANAVGITNQAFNNVEAGQARNVARYGMSQTAEQQAAQSSAMELGRSTATVDAENNTRMMLKDRDRAIATGGLGSSGGTTA